MQAKQKYYFGSQMVVTDDCFYAVTFYIPTCIYLLEIVLRLFVLNFVSTNRRGDY